jgi:phage portal protein BeeE
LVPFTTAIAQRLSFDDVTGNGLTVDFDYTPFLRVDPTMRADLYAKLIPLGVMTPEEARAFEQLTPTPNMPTPTDPAGGIEGPPRTGTTP